MLRFSRLKFALFSLALAVLTLWITTQSEKSIDTADELATQNESYSWQLTDSTTWQIPYDSPDKQSIIQTQKMLYQDSIKQSDFTHPKVLQITPQQTVSIMSQKGQSIEDQIITFDDNVVIMVTPNTLQTDKTTHTAPQNKTLKTQSITYNSKTNMITSDQDVSITQPGAKTTGTGLRANLETDNFKLLSNVKVEYNPQVNAAPSK